VLSTPDPWNAVAEGYDQITRPAFETFTREALALAAPGKQARLLDVATGPGTLPLLAAEDVASIVAIDFSEEMLRLCRRNVAHLPNVDVRHGDGQALSFDQAFDAAFSLFGLIFFDDRAAGFAGLHRALVPGGTAVVSAWPPPARSTAMSHGIALMHAALPDTAKQPPPTDGLNSADALVREMEAAGFVDVHVQESRFAFTATADAFWRGLADAFAPITFARRTMPAEVWQAAEDRGRAWLEKHHDADAELEYVALLGRGTRPA